MKYANFADALTEKGHFTVTEIIDAPRVENGQEFKLTDLYHPSLVIRMRACPDECQVGDTYDMLTGIFYPAPVVETAAADDGDDTGHGEPPPPPPTKP